MQDCLCSGCRRSVVGRSHADVTSATLRCFGCRLQFHCHTIIIFVTPPMAPHLQNLPSELLLLILEYICILPNATPSLESLCLTSERLRSLAEPFLYASYSNAKHIDKPHLFPISLLNRPDLADYLRKIDIHVESGVNPMPEDTFRHLQKAMEELHLPESLIDYWKRLLASIGLSRAAACAELSLLLASRKMQTISLKLNSSHEFSVIGHMLFETPNWSGRFDQVQSI